MTITTVISLFVDVVTKATVDGVIDCIDAALPVVADTIPVFLFIDTTPFQVVVKNLAGCVADLVPETVPPLLPYPLGTVTVIVGVLEVATSTSAYPAGLVVIGVAPLPVVVEIIPSQLTDNVPFQSANVNNFGGCIAVALPLTTEPALK